MRHPTIHPLLLSGIEGGWLRETEAFPGDFYVSRLGDPVLTKIRVSVRSLHQQYRHHLGTCWKCSWWSQGPAGVAGWGDRSPVCVPSWLPSWAILPFLLLPPSAFPEVQSALLSWQLPVPSPSSLPVTPTHC